MNENKSNDLYDELFFVINRHVKLSLQSKRQDFDPDSPEAKIDVLERILELLRIERRHLENDISMEEFIQGKTLIQNGVLQYYETAQYHSQGNGTPPICFQPGLLVFLLMNYRNRQDVYDIIDSFINKVWSHLGTLDFKKTRTGVIRCFTNTRFAALTLRNYGLLKFTKAEAFKTWSLSLIGMIVAAKVIEKGVWALPPVSGDKKWSSELHPDIHTAFKELADFEVFTKRLADMCNPKIGSLDNKFKNEIGSAFKTLCEFKNVIDNTKTSKDERKINAGKLLKTLDENEGIKKLFGELTLSLKTGDVLAQSYAR